MINLNNKYHDLVAALKDQAPFTPDVALILGSGLGEFAGSVDTLKTISTVSLPGYPPSTVQGHEGKIHFAHYAGKNLMLFQGRIHFYEGYKLSQCVLPVFLAHKTNCRKVILTNAAGGINPVFVPGDLMLNASFNAYNIKKELSHLIGIISRESKDRILSFPSPGLNDKIRRAAMSEGICLREGVYWYVKGPSYETPSEIKMIGRFGGDAVGMSTVHEALYASYLGMEVAAITCITNYAAGISPVKLSHAEVTETANRVKHTFESLIKKIITLVD
ncbi:MAG: purine-nucleoside phosphorylase [Ignavibacteria bacterium]|jgi:purine-nucleoside phosphorylase|nr:purine-nucleoside phosphorylase [Ignavibacteria bacterium]MCU7501468.1 purine-nucleoside phosphorylase [Ignavibacteria bacterium]MCU7516016.1 purine-nucleoside phosphorylase [Ignavibacteria bacterium]